MGFCNGYAVDSHGSSKQMKAFVMVTQSIHMDRVSKCGCFVIDSHGSSANWVSTNYSMTAAIPERARVR